MKKITLLYAIYLRFFRLRLKITEKSKVLYLTLFCLLISSVVNAQFDYASEVEPNNSTTDSNVQTLTVAGANTTTIIGGSTTVGTDEDYWKIGRSPLSNGYISMSVASNSGSMQPEVWLEKRTGSYDGPIASSTLIHAGTDQSNRAMGLTYSAANEYYLLRIGGGRSGGYSYRVNFPRCNTPGLTTILSTEPTENDFTITGLAGSTNLSLIKINTVDSFTNPSSGTTYPTSEGTAYSGSGEQTVYLGTSATPNVTVTGLNANTTYYVKVFNYSDCGGNLRLNAGNVFTVTTCGALPTTATELSLSSNNHNSSYISTITASATASTRFVVKANTVNNFTPPTNGITLPSGNAEYGGGEQVVYAGDSATPSTLVRGLTTGTEYFFKVYTANLCGGMYYFETTGIGSSITPECAAPNSNSGVYLYAEPAATHNAIGVVNFTGNNNADGKVIYMSNENNFTLPTILATASLPTASTDYEGKTGQSAIYTGAGTGFRITTTGLLPNTTYYYAVVNYKECNGILYFYPEAVYSESTTCGITSSLASNAIFNNIATTGLDLNSFTAPSATVNAAEGYVIKMNTVNSFSPLSLGTTLPTGNTAYAGGEQVIYAGTSDTPNLSITGLTEGTTYYFSIYAYKDCDGTPVYQQTGYTFSQTTLGISFTPPVLAYGSGATTLNASTTSTGTISYSLINDTTGAAITGSELTPGAVGNTTLRVSVAADGIYNAMYKDYDLTITKGSPVITWNMPATINEGVAIDASYLNASANTAGTYEYYSYYNPFANLFSGRITEGVTTLNTTSNTRNLYVRFIPSDSNYNIAIGSAPIAVTSLTGNILEITPNDIIKALGDTDPTLTPSFTVGKLKSGEIIWVPLKREPGETVGTYVISIDQTMKAPASFDPGGVCPTGVCIGSDPFGYGYIDAEDTIGAPITNGNYTIELQTGTFTVTNKEELTISLNASDLTNRFYTGSPRAAVTTSNIVVTTTGVAPATTPSLNYSYSGNDYLGRVYGPSTTPPTNAGTYKVKASVATNDANYFGSVEGSFTILQHTIVLSPDNPQFYVYDGLPKTFEATATGLLGENVPLTINYRTGTYYSEAPPINIGTYPILIRVDNSANYLVSYTGSLTITDKTEVTINLTDLTHQYDGTRKQVSISSIETSPGVAASPTPTVNFTYEGINGTAYRKSSTAPISGGEYNVYAHIDTGDPNFFGSTNATLTIIEKETVTINFDSNEFNYDGTSQGTMVTNITDSNGVEITPAYTISYSGTDVDDKDYGPSTTPPTNAGDYVVEVTISTTDPLYKGDNFHHFSINKRTIEVTADEVTKVYGDNDPSFTYQITSGSLLGGDAFTGNLIRAVGENIGNYTITKGTLDVTFNYNVSLVTNKLIITKRPIEITADAVSKIYGDTDPSFTYEITSGSLAGSDVFAGVLERALGENLGSYILTQGTLGINANYDISFVANDLMITKRAIEVTADAASKVYGEGDPTFTYQITSGSLAGSDVFAGVLERTLGENVGTYALTQGTLGINANYDISFVANDLTITKRAIEITADAASKVYGEGDPTFTYQITSGSLANGDAFGGILERPLGEAVGSYTLTQGTLGINANYDISFVANDLMITKRAIEVTADAASKVYGEGDPTFTYQITSGSLANGDAFGGILERPLGEAVGNYTLTQGTLGINGNYAITFVANDLTITKRAIEITADAASKVYGEGDPTFTYQITSGSLANGDAFGGILERPLGEAVGNYTLTQGTLGINQNYAISFVANDLTITKRAIEITADAASKVYGEGDPTFTYQITSGSLANGDVFGGILERPLGEAIGNYTLTQGTLGINQNYAISFVANDLTIAKRAIEITADAQSKIYGNIDSTFTYQITSGSLAGSDVFSGVLERVSGENIGVYAINQGTLEINSNYEISFVSDDLTITKRPISIKANETYKVIGETDPALTYDVITGSLIGTDAFTGNLEREAGESIGSYAINQGTVTIDNNYNLTYVSANFEIVESNNATALHFEGPTDQTYDYIEVADNASLDFTNAFTFETWVNFDEITRYDNGWDWQALFAKSRFNESYGLMLLTEGSKVLRFYHTGFGTGYTDFNWTASLAKSTWYHVAVTFSGTKTAIYIDGVEVASQTANAANLVPNDNSLIIGANKTAGTDPYPFRGKLDEVRFWNIARTETQINEYKSYELEGNETGLVLYYDMNQGLDLGNNTAITQVTDKSSKENNGTLQQFALTGSVSNFVADATNGVLPKEEQLITFNVIPTKTYSDADFDIAATSDKGLAITYTSSDEDVATVQGSTISIKGLGTTVITASQAGTAVYKSATATQTLTVTAGLNQSIWNGSLNADWNANANWSDTTVPAITNNVIIPSVRTTPEIETGIQINDLTIEDFATMTIQKEGAVQVDGDLMNNGGIYMMSTPVNSSSLLVKGAANGMVTYERDGLIANERNIISVPVSGQSIKEFVENPANNIRLNTSTTPNTYGVGYYDDTRAQGDKWVYYTVDDLITNSITFDKGKSYAISRETDGKITFTGTVTTTDVATAINASEWNAVGNPFTAFLPLNTNSGANFINTNSSVLDPAYVATYTWSSTQNKYVANSLVDAEVSLAPSEGFLIKAAAGANVVNFNKNQRLIQPILGGSMQNMTSITLTARNATRSVTTDINYINGANQGLDTGYDIGNHGNAAFDVYTHLLANSTGIDFTTQSLPDSGYESMVIPVGLRAVAGSEVYFSAESFNLPAGLAVFLEDTKEGTYVELKAGEEHLVNLTENEDGIGRFYLHTKSATLKTNETNTSKIKMYNYQNELFINGIVNGNLKISLYNTTGLEVYATELKADGNNRITLSNLAAGIYIVRLNTAFGTKTKKIMLK